MSATYFQMVLKRLYVYRDLWNANIGESSKGMQILYTILRCFFKSEIISKFKIFLIFQKKFNTICFPSIQVAYIQSQAQQGNTGTKGNEDVRYTIVKSLTFQYVFCFKNYISDCLLRVPILPYLKSGSKLRSRRYAFYSSGLLLSSFFFFFKLKLLG